MGTLTANQTRLPDYCEHKLPTSCRLSSIPNCCACADERAHSASYSTYIDGVGFVPRGNRWQRYCWFCKEFWEERVQISGLRPGQTRIPEVPDQTEFLKQWYEFHQGYRIVVKEDGTEERVSVLGEDFKDVSPGCLPRTLEQLRAGRRAEEVQQAAPAAAQEHSESVPNLDATLEQMFADASLESEQQSTVPSDGAERASRRPAPVLEPPVRSTNIHGQAMNPAGSRNRDYQMRRVAALRRELGRMRNGIERVITGLRDLGEDVPNYTETTDRLTALGETLNTITGVPSQQATQQGTTDPNSSSSTAQSQQDRTLESIQIRVDAARNTLNDARRARDQAANELDQAEQELRASQHRFHQLQREQRTTENYMRIFGTREEVIAQGENYESPIGGMFTRAEERFRAAEQVRREQRTLRQVLEDENRVDGDVEARRLAELDGRPRDVWGVPQPSSTTLPQATDAALQAGRTRAQAVPSSMLEVGLETPPGLVATADESALEEYYAMLRRQDQRQTDSTYHTSTSGQDTNAHQTVNFPRSMLNAIVAARGRELAGRSDLEAEVSPAEIGPMQNENVSRIVESVALDFSAESWWHQDANHIIRSLTSDDNLREEIGMTPQEASVLLAYFIDDVVSENDRMVIDGLMRNATVIWRTNLPAEWIRRRQEGPNYPRWDFFDGSGFPGSTDWAGHYNSYMQTELVAQAYQMSASLRQLAPGLNPPERLQLLFRLQDGQRNTADVAILEAMRDNYETYSECLNRYRERVSTEGDPAEGIAAQDLHNSRRAMAWEGDHSRIGLDSRRRETTQAFALAAGRQAMETGSQALIDRMTDRDEGTRAAYNRLTRNTTIVGGGVRGGVRLPRPTLYRQLSLSDYLQHSETDTDSESDKEEEQARGLDALNTGRPEPKSDEELQVSMECKICYTQISEVACLPCGHLVMCRWCSDQHSPCLTHDATRPRRAANCPVCRKSVRQKVRVFRA